MEVACCNVGEQEFLENSVKIHKTWHLNDQQCTSIIIPNWKNTRCCRGAIHITRPSVTPHYLICIPQTTIVFFSLYILPDMYWLMAIFSFCVISPDCIFIVHVMKINVCSHNPCSALLLKIWVVAWRIFFWDELFAFCAAANTFCIFSKVTGACSLFSSSGAVSSVTALH